MTARADIGLDTIIHSIRQCGPRAGAEQTIGWRMGLLRELCRVVENAHACGLAHPRLSTRHVRVDRLGQITILGWRTARSRADEEADITALGSIAFELLTLDTDPTAPAPLLPTARVQARPRRLEPGWFVPVACSVALAFLVGGPWAGLAACAVAAISFASRARSASAPRTPSGSARRPP